jgi:hypothetical protein
VVGAFIVLQQCGLRVYVQKTIYPLKPDCVPFQGQARSVQHLIPLRLDLQSLPNGMFNYLNIEIAPCQNSLLGSI